MSSGKRTFFAFIGGVATGYLLGVLFAPDSGKNTRDKLAYQLDKYLEKLNQMVSEAKEQQAAPGVDRAGSELNLNDQRRAEELLREVENFMSQLDKK